jgi:hypothetical protein
MAAVHIVMQGKGGVGKSFVCYLLYQYLRQLNFTVKGFDTDPNNASFARYPDMDVSIIQLMNGVDIDVRGFDRLINEICYLPDDCHAVVDNGTSSYIAFCAYMVENDTLTMLKDMGHRILLHSVITGGAAMVDTCANLQNLFDNFPGFPVIAWLNPKDGEIVSQGKDFSGFKVFEENEARFQAVIAIPPLRAALAGRDLTEMLVRQQTFAQALEDKSLSIPVKQRLTKLWRDFNHIFDKAGIC